MLSVLSVDSTVTIKVGPGLNLLSKSSQSELDIRLTCAGSESSAYLKLNGYL